LQERHPDPAAEAGVDLLRILVLEPDAAAVGESEDAEARRNEGPEAEERQAELGARVGGGITGVSLRPQPTNRLQAAEERRLLEGIGAPHALASDPQRDDRIEHEGKRQVRRSLAVDLAERLRD